MTVTTVETPSPVEAAKAAEEAADTLTKAIVQMPDTANLDEVTGHVHQAVYGLLWAVEEIKKRTDDRGGAYSEASDAAVDASEKLLDAVKAIDWLRETLVDAQP